MAGKSKVGSLYYEVLLDPSGYARGVTKVRSQQKMLLRSIEKTNSKIGKSNEQLKRDYKKNMLERVANLRKLLQEGKITSERFKELYAGEARSYKHFQDSMTQEAINQAKRRAAVQERENRRQARLREEKRDAIYRGERGFMPMFREHRARINQSMISGGAWGQMTQIANSMQMMFMKFWPFLVGWQVLKGVVESIARSVWSIIKAADARKVQTNILSQLVGSKEDAKRMQRQLIDYAKRTAFGVDQTMELSNQLIALGYSAREAVDGIELFGNLSFGDPYRLRLIAKAFSDVKAQGKLMMTEVRQFANQGVPLLAQLGLQLGKTNLEVRQMITEGLIGEDDVKRALDRISQRYGDTAGAAMNTSVGQLEMIKETLGEIMVVLGTPLSNSLRDNVLKPLGLIAERIEELVGDGDSEPSWFGKWASWAMGKAALGPYKQMMGPLGSLGGVALGAAETEKGQGIYSSSLMQTAIGFVEWARGISAEDYKYTDGTLMGDRGKWIEFQYAWGQITEEQRNLLHKQNYNEIKRQELLDQEEARIKDEMAWEEHMKEVNGKWWGDPTFGNKMKELQNEQEEIGLDSVALARLRYERELEALLLQEKISDSQKNQLMAEYDRVQGLKPNQASSKSGTMASLPSNAFRQNSVEEFRYLEAKRSEAYRNQVVNQNTAAINANTQAIQNMPISTGGSGVVQATSGGSV